MRSMCHVHVIALFSAASKTSTAAEVVTSPPLLFSPPFPTFSSLPLSSSSTLSSGPSSSLSAVNISLPASRVACARPHPGGRPRQEVNTEEGINKVVYELDKAIKANTAHDGAKTVYSQQGCAIMGVKFEYMNRAKACYKAGTNNNLSNNDSRATQDSSVKSENVVLLPLTVVTSKKKRVKEEKLMPSCKEDAVWYIKDHKPVHYARKHMLAIIKSVAGKDNK